MSRIELKTLTPIHIGNGNFLQNNADFVVYRENDDSFINVIDPRKILALVGEEHLEDWMLSIENSNDTVASFVGRHNKYAKPDDYALRVITNYADVKRGDTLKECLHNGMGLYYIPGSSIKGAIRTAVLSTLSKGKALESKIKDRSNRINAKQVEKDFFGKDPNRDVFRFLQVGDAYFDGDCGIATRMVNLNIRKKDDLMDYSKTQIVEAIGLENSSTLQMKIAGDYYRWVKSQKPEDIADLPQGMESLSSLFMLINIYSEELISSEIDSWTELQERYSGAEHYIENMQSILEEIKKCRKGKECVLRIGYGIGWRFITGGWSESLGNFDEVVSASRPKNHLYNEYVFPKSRRLDEDSDVFGFVKLLIND
ncbi:type III-A CRISPR-associated RAMP protein Csm5 [uncultured Parabacteroides sp.]|uniref:type III-A CRISPR-associated RAMP protein Csm5 n=1 Tax=uncultured Parabacteroides sp. TaxID=512312 RepID=UPI0025EC5600|nr:type III-A CRISPR-associated RAMP protein Csm5 [uncultured Parabacteroides sp.]